MLQNVRRRKSGGSIGITSVLHTPTPVLQPGAVSFDVEQGVTVEHHHPNHQPYNVEPSPLVGRKAFLKHVPVYLLFPAT